MSLHKQALMKSNQERTKPQVFLENIRSHNSFEDGPVGKIKTITLDESEKQIIRNAGFTIPENGLKSCNSYMFLKTSSYQARKNPMKLRDSSVCMFQVGHNTMMGSFRKCVLLNEELTVIIDIFETVEDLLKGACVRVRRPCYANSTFINQCIIELKCM